MAEATGSIYPALRYEDAPAAIEWLGRAFGFEKLMVVPGETDATVSHAELRLGHAVIMLGTDRDDAWPVRSPRRLGGTSTSLYVAIDDVDAHHDLARSEGADIVMAVHDTDYGSREYTARDPEGHLWSFGTYRPEA
jgi:uncharacterized glyoxalase superfamily protein PhnB